MPLHIAMVLPLPKNICYSIEKLMRNFLWSGNDNHQRMHYVSWKKIYLPKEEGGLGVKYISEVNEACFLKLGWRAISTNNLWATWFRSRYMNKVLYHALSYSSPFGSCIWRRICMHLPALQHGTKWIIGSGRLVNLWHDQWILNSSLSSLFPSINFAYISLSSGIPCAREFLVHPSNLPT